MKGTERREPTTMAKCACEQERKDGAVMTARDDTGDFADKTCPCFKLSLMRLQYYFALQLPLAIQYNNVICNK